MEGRRRTGAVSAAALRQQQQEAEEVEEEERVGWDQAAPGSRSVPGSVWRRPPS